MDELILAIDILHTRIYVKNWQILGLALTFEEAALFTNGSGSCDVMIGQEAITEIFMSNQCQIHTHNSTVIALIIKIDVVCIQRGLIMQ